MGVVTSDQCRHGHQELSGGAVGVSIIANVVHVFMEQLAALINRRRLIPGF